MIFIIEKFDWEVNQRDDSTFIQHGGTSYGYTNTTISDHWAQSQD